ncbi:hypothetical protein C8Q76DRAFT_634530 [Earliella scabrosa]|nr:hypothetical protein C8Q76DRAFT_634530 [Earliella scabrosa]
MNALQPAHVLPVPPVPLIPVQAGEVEQPPARAAPEPVTIPDEEDIPFDAYVAQVMEIIPDVLPAHVYSLMEEHHPKHKENVVEAVLHAIFENPDYPKIDAKGKRKREDDDQPQRAVKPKIDYGDKSRKAERGPHYPALAIEQLESDFADIPTAHIRQTFVSHNALYAPTYLALQEQQASHAPPYKKMARGRTKGKGKRVQRHDPELEKEMQWIQEKREEEDAKRAAEIAEELRVQEEGGIECGCCFSEYPFEKMVQCPEAHLFCTTCMITYAETKLGEHDARISCMDQSGCKLLFPDSELRRFLTPKLLELYERVKQRKEIEAAGLEGLEECPFCEYKVVIENEQERLFRCENEACGAVTCRKCKKLDHLPKSCQEVEDDKKLDVRHAIEEAMTRALMRNCPKCQKAFVKEMGCNKMTCPNCGTLSCYICRKVIVGYDHFNNPPGQGGRSNSKKCPLWDASVEGRHSDEVTAAAKKALEEYKRAHPELDEKEIAVDLPPPAAGPSRGTAAEAFQHVRVPVAPLPLHQFHPVAGPANNRVERIRDWRDDMVEALGRVRAAEMHLPHHHQQAMGPVFNLQVHINQPAQAGPAYPPPPPAPVLPFMAPHGPAPVPPAPRVRAPVAARPRRSARKRGR